MSDPVKLIVQNAVQSQSGSYKAQLVDENRVPISYATLTSLTLTLYDLRSSVIVNGRNAQNVLNANQVTMDVNGNIVWTWLPADMPLLVPTVQQEEHVALFVAKWTDSGGNARQANHEVHFYVNKIPLVS